jgi:hypothetical protein
VTERQLAVDHVVEDAAQAPNVRLEGDLDDSGPAGSLALVLNGKCWIINSALSTKLMDAKPICLHTFCLLLLHT